MRYTYDLTNHKSLFSCKLCEKHNDEFPCSHNVVMLDAFNKGKFSHLYHKDSDIYEAINLMKKEEEEKEYAILKEKNEAVLDKLLQMLQKADYIPVSSKLEIEPVLYKSLDFNKL